MSFDTKQAGMRSIGAPGSRSAEDLSSGNGAKATAAIALNSVSADDRFEQGEADEFGVFLRVHSVGSGRGLLQWRHVQPALIA